MAKKGKSNQSKKRGAQAKNAKPKARAMAAGVSAQPAPSSDIRRAHKRSLLDHYLSKQSGVPGEKS